MPSRVEEKISWLERQILSRRDWLSTHGTKKAPWPEHDIASKEYGLEMMIDIREDYQKSLEKARSAA